MTTRVNPPESPPQGPTPGSQEPPASADPGVAAPTNTRRNVLRAGGVLGLSSLMGTATLMAQGGDTKAAVEWAEHFQKNYRLMTAEEKAEARTRLETRYSTQYGKKVDVDTTEAQPGMLMGYALNIRKCIGCLLDPGEVVGDIGAELDRERPVTSHVSGHLPPYRHGYVEDRSCTDRRGVHHQRRQCRGESAGSLHSPGRCRTGRTARPAGRRSARACDASGPVPWRWVTDELRALDEHTLLGMTRLDLPLLRRFVFPFLLEREPS